MAKADSKQATETLHEIESIFDRLAQWVARNPVPVLAIVATLLAGAAGLGGLRAWRADREANASAELAAVEAEYRLAMGAEPGAFDIPEPANPEIATMTRRDFTTRFGELADRHAGSTAAVVARLRAADLLEELGDREAALAAWRAASEAAPEGSALDAVAHARLAAGLEAAGDPAAAAVEYLAAGQAKDFPGRILALGDAARCFADAGQPERALEVFGSISAEDAAKLPPHVAARLGELRLSSQAPR